MPAPDDVEPQAGAGSPGAGARTSADERARERAELAVTRFEDASAVVAGLLTGVMVGIVGTVFHRYQWNGLPLGVVVALVAVVTAIAFTRALGGMAALAGFVVTTLAAVAAMTWLTPGADHIVLPDAVGITWGVGVVLACALGLALPRHLFEGRGD